MQVDRFDGNKLKIGIPIESSLAYWGTSEWHITDDGQVGKAHELFGVMLSHVMGREVALPGFVPHHVVLF